MLCNNCHKAEATVHLTQIVDNEMKTVDLCEPCSKEKGGGDPTGFPWPGLLMSLAGTKDTAKSEDAKELKCPECGFSQTDLKKSGRLGCAHCYTVFKEPLDGLLKTMHTGDQHVGKVPHCVEKTSVLERLKMLQTTLDEAVNNEAYEDAARLRDQIKAIRKKMAE